LRTYIGTRSGVYRLDADGLTPLGLDEHRFWAIHAWCNERGEDTLLAGSYGAGMFRSEDSGRGWQPANDGISATYLRSIQPDPSTPGAFLCGTEPARLFRSTDEGRSWRELSAIADLPGCADWYLPYSPRAGALRNIYAPPGRPQRLYASIEVGGLLFSDGCGETWELRPVEPGPRVHDDIHYVTGDPADPDVLYVALGGALLSRKNLQIPGQPRRIGGVARSDEGGRNWRKLLLDYTRAIFVPPARPDLLLAAPAERTDHGGWIVVSSDAGETWERADAGIETPMPDMVERFEPAPDGSIWAICSGGRVFRAMSGEWRWTTPLPATSGIDVDAVSFVAD
jgi:photosystem II stability/assembly factor-like uncharacterized protein